ncbi:T9SS type A sorting domain-containing protein [Thalassobellus suaedae]|uniref:T9SS type A sorting domain-containing protein n=1 Tax=Thalassobellus suaedae TaxID=3074124 RepID=A0ABY9Y3C5_9FLAO|nr:T9SS type A sorting domain-containing protein [Flavobacteriaceae bacterium HL-DH10]
MPFQNQFYINFGKAEKVEQISVYNVLGKQIRLIKGNEIKSQTLKIDINDKTGNLFIVKIVTANGVINRTIIKK